jgi:hypothetical protein
MKQKNCHARAKRKLKVLKLKAFWRRVIEKRFLKKQKSFKTKGTTITGSSKAIAPHVTEFYPLGEYKRLFARGTQPPNQRQRRKLQRQTQRY